MEASGAKELARPSERAVNTTAANTLCKYSHMTSHCPHIVYTAEIPENVIIVGSFLDNKESTKPVASRVDIEYE